jgi:MinD-like ATPase involved in chromosome partitioning or flagellar assembly
VVSLVGSALSEQLRQAALIDGTREGSRLSDVYGLDPENTLVEMLRRGRQPVDVRTSGPHGSDLFLGTDDAAWDSVPPTSIRNFYEHLRDRVEITLVDVGSIEDPSTVPWLGHADEFVVVTGSSSPTQVDDVVTIGNTFDVEFRGVVVNGVGTDQLDSVATEWSKSHVPLLSILPRDEVARESAQASTSVLTYDPDSELSTIGWQLAEQLADPGDSEPVLPEAVSIEAALYRNQSSELDPTDMVTEQPAQEQTAGAETTPGPQADETEHTVESTSFSESPSFDHSVDQPQASDSLDDPVDTTDDLEEQVGDYDDSGEQLDFDGEEDFGDWRDVDIGESPGEPGDGDRSIAEPGDTLSDWRENTVEESDDDFQTFSQSSTDGGLSDWGTAESDDAPEEDQSDDRESESTDEPDDQIEAAFQEAMEQAKEKQLGDEEPSIEDLLE